MAKKKIAFVVVIPMTARAFLMDDISPWMDIKVFFTTIKKVLMRADINTATGQAATMDYFNGNN